MPEPTRIAFIGEIHSSHAQSWIALLNGFRGEFSVQAVHLGPATPPDLDFPVRSFSSYPSFLQRILRRLGPRLFRRRIQGIAKAYPFQTVYDELWVLIETLIRFKPHIVHSFGFIPAALIYSAVPPSLRADSRWVLQTRGGSDVAFTQWDPDWQALFRMILPQAHAVVCDNEENYKAFARMGIQVRRDKALPILPGTGGVTISSFEPVLPLEQREPLLLWSKAYECPWSKSLPVLEALRIAWPEIAPLRCIFTSVCPETRNWVRLLPEEMQNSIELHDRLPHGQMLELMRRARVVLAPSLVDGIPNTLYECMAAGAIPVVSPLPTLTPHFRDGENVWYAQNLFPHDLARAIVRAFKDPACSGMISRNHDLVRTMADRSAIAGMVREFYKRLA